MMQLIKVFLGLTQTYVSEGALAFKAGLLKNLEILNIISSEPWGSKHSFNSKNLSYKSVVQLNNLAARKDSALAICHIAQTGYENIELIIKYQLHEFMFNIAYNSNNTEFLMPVLRFFGSMSFSSDEHTQILLEKDIKVLLIKTLNSKCPELIRDSLWIMSNMAAGTIEQIDYIFE